MASEELDELYQAIILDHFKSPRCQHQCSQPVAHSEKFNRLCGDRVVLTLEGTQAKVSCVYFTGKGCAISQASASLMSELCTNKSKQEIMELSQIFKTMITDQSDCHEDDMKKLADAGALSSLSKFPARYRCALLAWEAMQESLSQLPS